MAISTKSDPIRLLISEADRNVVVEPEDNDKFVLRVKEAIVACRVLADYKSLFEGQLDHLKNILGAWASKRKEKIHKVFLTLQDARMLFLVVTKQQTYDTQLEEELADLDLEIAQDPECSKINLDVQALPYCAEDSYISFCNPEWVLEYLIHNA